MIDQRLVRFSANHVDARVDWLSHPAVLAGVPIAGSITVESTAEWFRRVRSDDSRADFVYLDDGGAPAVMCGITGIDEVARRGELYMFVGPVLHGRGFGSRALNALCEWGFRERRLNRIFLYTMGPNEDARRFYERAGFLKEGHLREHYAYRGAVVDRIIHGLLSADWTSVGGDND
ncbi:MAG: GNAT family protein [Nocardioides sp.]|nr:GNAT family protein [Nocardioides sp.]